MTLAATIAGRRLGRSAYVAFCALAAILLLAVIAPYALYDRLVGIDRMRLG